MFTFSLPTSRRRNNSLAQSPSRLYISLPLSPSTSLTSSSLPPTLSLLFPRSLFDSLPLSFSRTFYLHLSPLVNVISLPPSLPPLSFFRQCCECVCVSEGVCRERKLRERRRRFLQAAAAAVHSFFPLFARSLSGQSGVIFH